MQHGFVLLFPGGDEKQFHRVVGVDQCIVDTAKNLNILSTEPIQL